MTNYIVTNTELTSVANAIRTAGGTDSQLEFPDGFVSAIGSISGGGGGNPEYTINCSKQEAVGMLNQWLGPIQSELSSGVIADFQNRLNAIFGD